MATKVLIRDLEKPPEKNIEEDIEWVCECFGFYERIDREKTASLIFKKLLESRTNGGGLSSTKLGEETSVTRAAALNHLKRMMCSGLVVKDGNEYKIRCASLFQTINEIHRDVDRIFEDIEEIAKDIDEHIGVKYRRY
jgi:predicted transcriptional regulator